jgi:Leucine-rich repeat (LRR) protein
MQCKLLNKKYNINETHIDISRRILTEFPTSLLNFRNLTILRINDNYLTTLPCEISILSTLTTLEIINNYLETIPDTIGKLIRLEELYLSSNKLKTLPKSIEKLTRLKLLNLSNNQISNLPNSIEKLVSLECLNLSDNQLTKLPFNVEKLPNAKKLKLILKNNNLRYLSFNTRNMKKTFANVTIDAYDIDNLDFNCEIVIICDLNIPLLNLPFGLKEIWLYKPIITNIKFPFECVLYIDEKKQIIE